MSIRITTNKHLISFFFILISVSYLFGQEDFFSGKNTWSTLYLNKKIDKNNSFQLLSIYGMNNSPFKFSFNQNNLSFTHKLDRKQSISIGYTKTFCKWSPYYNKYGLNINFLGLIGFDRIFGKYSYKTKISNRIRLTYELKIQYFIQKIDKYRSRIIYGNKIYYYKKNNLMGISPFFQYKVYYYQGGNPVIYYNKDGSILSFKSPNGFHNLYLKGGISFKPFKQFNHLRLKVYYLIQQEFNLPFSGTKLNVKSENQLNDISNQFYNGRSEIKNAFNNSKTFGFQVNYYFQ